MAKKTTPETTAAPLHPSYHESLVVRGRRVGVDITRYDSDELFERDVLAAEKKQGITHPAPKPAAPADDNGPAEGSGNADGVNSTNDDEE